MSFKSHFKFNKQERSGIFFLLLVIVVLQVCLLVYKSYPAQGNSKYFKIDSLQQATVTRLKREALVKDSVKWYPFNPNFISDYKGYTLGMSPAEIDRLHAFRKTGSYVNSAEEFQAVTEVSDSLLRTVAPYFKFPDWTEKRGTKVANAKAKNQQVVAQVVDLNLATEEELQTIKGIGATLSARIVKFRDRLGGFMVADQLYDVYGLEPQVVKRALQRFKVMEKPLIEKININTASVEELQKLIYLQKKVAIGIVNYRNNNKSITSFEELSKIENFPSDKLDRIVLYLSL